MCKVWCYTNFLPALNLQCEPCCHIKLSFLSGLRELRYHTEPPVWTLLPHQTSSVNFIAALKLQFELCYHGNFLIFQVYVNHSIITTNSALFRSMWTALSHQTSSANHVTIKLAFSESLYSRCFICALSSSSPLIVVEDTGTISLAWQVYILNIIVHKL